jgi:glycosyltransferase involved in cell wall biosynthesis
VVNNYRNKDIITIGWSGSVSTAQYLYLLENIFRKLATRFRFRVLAMGDPNLRMEGVDLEAVPWKESYEMEVLGQFDIGVYPLPEEEWVLGKSGLKAIQYMALGIPTVATAIGANFRVIEDGVSGYLVKTEDEWIEALSRLMEDEELRRRIGMNARKRVEERFSIRANKDTYLRILEEV